MQYGTNQNVEYAENTEGSAVSREIFPFEVRNGRLVITDYTYQTR